MGTRMRGIRHSSSVCSAWLEFGWAPFFFVLSVIFIVIHGCCGGVSGRRGGSGYQGETARGNGRGVGNGRPGVDEAGFRRATAAGSVR